VRVKGKRQILRHPPFILTAFFKTEATTFLIEKSSLGKLTKFWQKDITTFSEGANANPSLLQKYGTHVRDQTTKHIEI
jgi:hypothetical protein